MLLGCEATIFEPTAEEPGLVDPRSPQGTDDPNDPRDPSVPDDPREPSEPTECATGETPIRRLSHFELERTLQAYFPQDVIPNLELPQDQAPYGFDNDHDALRANGILVEAQFELAAELSSGFAAAALSAVDCSEIDAAACGVRFSDHWGSKLFRRPLTREEAASYGSFFGPDLTLEQGATLALRALLASPDFLYHIELPATEVTAPGAYPLAPHSLAERLSYALWAAPPDPALLAAAEAGRLSSAEGMRAEAERMLADERARVGLRHFFGQWLDLDRLDRTSKLPEDGFDWRLREAMKEETLRLAEHLLFDDGGRVEDLLTSRTTFINASLAELYGVEVPADAAEWFPATIAGRAGVLSQASFLASHAHPRQKSPVLRGSFVLERLLCLNLGSPPAEAEMAMVPEGMGEPSTNRERYDAVTMTSPDCSYCHEFINNAGYAFENFDTMGRFVTDEDGVTIDASGELLGASYGDAVELARNLGSDPATVGCITENFLRYVFAGSPAGLDPCVLEDIVADVTINDGSLRELVLAVVSHEEFRTLRLNPAP